MKFKTPLDVVRNVKAIASLPAVFERINMVANQPNSSLGDVAAIIARDVGLTARLLKLVNSAYFGFPSKIESITQACVVAGTRNIQQLALATSVVEVFKSIPPSLLNMQLFWRHSVGCAMVSRSLAQMSGLLDVDRYFVVGMLHDIGRLAMLQTMTDEAAAIIRKAYATGQLTHQVEKECLGFTHADVGEALLNVWGLPQVLGNLVSAHHAPAGCRSGLREAGVPHFANIVAHALELGESGNPFVPPVEAGVWNSLGIEPSRLTQLVADLDNQFEDMAEILCGDAHA